MLHDDAPLEEPSHHTCIPSPGMVQLIAHGTMKNENLRQLLCGLGDAIRDSVLHGRKDQTSGDLSGVSKVCPADTIYKIDCFAEETVFSWLEEHWPETEPVELVMEGMEDGTPPVFPKQSLPAPRWTLIVDPIDGTRGIMYDKRSAWSLAGLAKRNPGESTSAARLSQITIAAMTEIPTRKQWRADQVSCVAGEGLRAGSLNLFDNTRAPLHLAPSGADNFEHGFCSLAKFFPEGRALTSQIEEAIWQNLLDAASTNSPLVFDDQYISTGGQFYEVLCGHDRLVGDIRPLVFAKLQLPGKLVCHPYDACTWPLLHEAGVCFEAPDGTFPDAPLDTTSAVTWIAYANRTLAEKARPVLKEILRKFQIP